MTFLRLVHNKFFLSASLLMILTVVGTTGFWFIGDGRYAVIDCFYMTVITLTTIGFGEVVDMSGKPGGRLFTIAIALTGIGTLSYIITNFTASIVEGDLSETFRRRRMDKLAGRLNEHFIVCGYGRIGRQIVHELNATNRPCTIVEGDPDVASDTGGEDGAVVIVGDATDNGVLARAGIERARGIFCVTNDDNRNLVITLTARQMNPGVRIVARCEDMARGDKIRSTGADAVVSPDFIGGLRMVSEMVRPTVVSFLDIMLRDKDRNLRVEEVTVPRQRSGVALKDLHLKRYPAVLLLAVKRGDGWVYNPPEDHMVSEGDSLIIMTNPEERRKLERDMNKA